jgi:hypothetical protein
MPPINTVGNPAAIGPPTWGLAGPFHAGHRTGSVIRAAGNVMSKEPELDQGAANGVRNEGIGILRGVSLIVNSFVDNVLKIASKGWV